METLVSFEGRTIARLYPKTGGGVTIDLSPARHAERQCGYRMPIGLKALDMKYGSGSFKAQCSVDTARDTVLRYARMSSKAAAAV